MVAVLVLFIRSKKWQTLVSLRLSQAKSLEKNAEISTFTFFGLIWWLEIQPPNDDKEFFPLDGYEQNSLRQSQIQEKTHS